MAKMKRVVEDEKKNAEQIAPEITEPKAVAKEAAPVDQASTPVFETGTSPTEGMSMHPVDVDEIVQKMIETLDEDADGEFQPMLVGPADGRLTDEQMALTKEIFAKVAFGRQIKKRAKIAAEFARAETVKRLRADMIGEKLEEDITDADLPGDVAEELNNEAKREVELHFRRMKINPSEADYENLLEYTRQKKREVYARMQKYGAQGLPPQVIDTLIPSGGQCKMAELHPVETVKTPLPGAAQTAQPSERMAVNIFKTSKDKVEAAKAAQAETVTPAAPVSPAAPVPGKKPELRMVRVATLKNHTMRVGGVTYNFVKGKEVQVPVEVKEILAGANLLKAL